MKKFLLMAMVLPLMTILWACGNDEPVSKTTINSKLITITPTSAEPFVSSGQYTYEVDNVKLKMNLTVATSFNQHMPVITMVIKDITIKAVTSDIIKFSVTSAVPVDENGVAYSEYTITDMQGVVDQLNGVQTIRYKVVSQRGTTQVFSFSSKYLSALGEDEGYIYFNPLTNEVYPTTTFCEYSLNNAKNTCSIFMYNVKFAQTMPTLDCIEIPDVPITYTSTGYRMEGTDIVPYYYDSDGRRIPMETRMVTNLESELNFITGDFTVSFDCMGKHFLNEAGNEANLNGCKSKLVHF